MDHLRLFKLAAYIIIIEFSFGVTAKGESPEISSDTVNAVVMCGPLDSESTDSKNCKEAIEILRKKSATGDPYADFYLSIAYENGISVISDQSKAFYYMLKAANGGDRRALYFVGISYLFGMGIPVDNQNALLWLGKSAYAGDVDGQYMLGEFYSDQKYGHQDLRLSYVWYEVASMGGMGDAKSMGDIIGSVLPPDERRSAEQIAEKLESELDSKNSLSGN